jgi:SPP1 gp7 family putative phage head morphogenesis protein
MAQDESPAKDLERELRRLGIRWRKRFNAAAPKLAQWFLQSVEDRSSAALRRILKDHGITVKFTMTPAMRDIVDASVAESVGLIKSIQQQYHTEVQGLVMRSVKAGRRLDVLTRELQQRYGVTRKRAALISRDQNNKATAALTRARQVEIGIEEAVWLHSAGGKEPRPTHVANSGKRYRVDEGWYDTDPRVRRRIFPGELINCRCVSRPIVKGFS